MRNRRWTFEVINCATSFTLSDSTLPPLPVYVDGDQHEGGGDEDGGDDGYGHTAVHLARLEGVYRGRGEGGGWQGAAPAVQGGHL